MKRLLVVSRLIDCTNERIGGVTSWLTLLMVTAGAYNAVARYAGRWIGHNLSSNALLEAQWYMFSLLFLLGAAHTLERDEHVRVDVLYGRLSKKAKAWLDLFGTALLALPFCAAAMWLTLPATLHSIEVREGSPDPGGLPRYPLKAMLLVAFALLFAQAGSVMIKKIAAVRGIGAPDDEKGEAVEGAANGGEASEDPNDGAAGSHDSEDQGAKS